MAESPSPGAGIEFTRPYYFESDRIVVKSDSPVQKPEDLAGKTLGVPLGTVEEIQAKEEEHADDLAELLRDLPKQSAN